ncbi:PREDICTED: uncharacterized protein LOC109335545 [Lupinus angustifolius]|uniref:uncharacterized protein LOC109335545 n=1 Tax=Lupinus angustifolius TaxID=3871 RepID=UPI00092E79AF|nr:PREDICTED: uncharacterized protein LOC109335545 [Lupinus angustifolius]
MNVYGPCDLVGKRLFWEEAKNDFLGRYAEMWCMAGDFNSILNRDERRGSSSSLVSSDCVEFSQFIEDLELLDLPLVGSKFTWFVSNGSAMSKLDRFLINDSWSSTWDQLVQMSLKRTFSDHCPTVLKYDVNDWGPSPFRTNNRWFSNVEFGKFVEGTWNDLEVNGRGSFILKEKLKLLKISLKRWNKEHFSMLDRKINDQVNFINYVDGKGNIEALFEEDISARRSATAELWRLSSQKDNLLCQKSRQSWLKEGDSNSKFFHASINQRRRSNRIPGLFIEGEWVDDPPRAIPGGIDFVNISDEDNSFLTAEFEEVEIKEAARKNKNEECFIFKVDFEKAYDSVNWSFLLYMMERMGFCVKWMNWIKSCLQSNSVSILVNESPTSEFNIVRGLRQGDPIAPFLFLIVVEGLAGIMRSGWLKGYSKYGDDTLLIGAKSAENIMVLKSILKCFELVSGLRINFHKSQFIGINSDEDFVQMAVHKLFCCVGFVPFKFLGIPQHNLISFGGRVTLIKSVLNSLSIYFFSFFKAPVAVILELEKIQRRFLWGRGEDRRGVHWVSWSKVCRSKGEGGLGVKNLSLFNLSLLGKWRWRLLFECDALWVRVLRSRYVARMGGSGGFSNPECFKRGSPWWRDLGCLGNRLFGNRLL